MKITMVKKILEDGNECKKCREVTERLNAHGEMDKISHLAYADVREPGSEGFKLAEKYNMDITPFFIVEENGNETVYKTYLELRKNAFNRDPDPDDIEIEEKRKAPPDELDFL
ncbi:MAG: hypothetical protein V5A47_02675 [Bacteroidales bacterium]|nr:hypothetical protein [Bacteroidales bacterium]MBS3774825.1 hypothetical protein [Bacteroidales bacterium]